MSDTPITDKHMEWREDFQGADPHFLQKLELAANAMEDALALACAFPDGDWREIGIEALAQYRALKPVNEAHWRYGVSEEETSIENKKP